MKILTLNFLTCARRACKSSASSFPLHPRDAELEATDIRFNLPLLQNLLPRLEWAALQTVCAELGLASLLPAEKPEREALVAAAGDVNAASGADAGDAGGGAMDVEADTETEDEKEQRAREAGDAQNEQQPSQLARDLHKLLLETSVKEGRLVCGSCEHAYEVKEGIANFLLPAHLV